ncbi:MAG: Aklanonic acid methyltransferase DauC [Candidatus Anoxychlamydiales bacterium]|nr:Aklanonic acid methyltransferase DauC [Candidatus Anoxychlamydiales bacterium]
MNKIDIKKVWAGIFTRAAPTYDQVGFKLFFYNFGKQLVELTEIPKKAKVLDVASGRGALLFPALKKVGLQGSVIGIDLAEGMVQKTSEEINKRGFSNAKMMQMDAENLKFQDNTFDIALYGFCIFFFPQYEIALNESYRVLKPYGRIGLSTFYRNAFNEIKWLDDLTEKYLPNNKEMDKQEEEPEVSEFETIEGMQKILIKAGYKDVHNKIEEKEFICENAEEFWKYLWSAGYRGEMERISSENLENFKEELTKNFHKYSFEDGLHWNIKVLFTFGRK